MDQYRSEKVCGDCGASVVTTRHIDPSGRIFLRFVHGDGEAKLDVYPGPPEFARNCADYVWRWLAGVHVYEQVE